MLPAKIEALMKLYNDHYHVLKAPRKLTWRPQLGAVEVMLTFEDRELRLKVTPLQASLLALFEEQSEWTVHDLQQRLKMEPERVEKTTAFFVNQRIIEEVRHADPKQHRYKVLESLPVSNPEEDDLDVAMEDGEDERGDGPQLDPQWEKIRSYVTGMLNVHPSAPLDRIHNMLRMFVSEPPYDRSIDELRDFLGTLVDKGVLECTNDTYSNHS